MTPSSPIDSDDRVPTIIVLGTESAGELLTLQRAAYLTEAVAHADLALPPLVETLVELEAVLDDPEVTVLGIREAGRLLGSVRLRRVDEAIELGRLVVAPDRQGEGLGTRLLLAADGWFASSERIRLFTGEHSRANLRLYARHGYTETHRTPAGDYALVHLVKELSGLTPA